MNDKPERLFAYVKHNHGSDVSIGLWTGKVISKTAELGLIGIFPCFGPFPSKRRAVRMLGLNGVQYVGWYYESSGDYCRLRKAKHQ